MAWAKKRLATVGVWTLLFVLVMMTGRGMASVVDAEQNRIVEEQREVFSDDDSIETVGFLSTQRVDGSEAEIFDTKMGLSVGEVAVGCVVLVVAVMGILYMKVNGGKRSGDDML